MFRLSLTFLFLALPAAALAQGTAADYERAAKLGALVRDKVVRAKVEPHWYDKDTKFWYHNDLVAGKKEFVVVDVIKGTREVVAEVDLPKGASELPAAGPRQRRPRQDRGPRAESPDGAWTAFVKDHNIWLRERAGGAETQLSKNGSAGDSYTGAFFWSPDSKKIVAIRRTPGGDRRVTLVESAPKDQLQPKTSTYFYLKPGDPIPQPKPHLFDASAKKEIPVDDALFQNPWDVSFEHWAPDSSRFLFFYNQRGHGVARVVALDAATGKAEAVVNEECKTFFDYTNKLYLQYFDGTGELLWMSERDGWNHLYLIDAKTGTVKTQITKGKWVVRGVDRVDVAAREVWFRAVGIDPAQDPYHVHFCKVKFDGTGLVRLTTGDGTHTVQYSPDRKYLIDTYSRADLPPVTELRNAADGKLVRELERADWSALLKAGWKAPERFAAKGRDGETDIYGLIFRPTNFDPKKKYPVIEDIYAGPHDHHVPKEFRALHRNAQSIAELGFVVVRMDGMGTNWRSKAFHDVCWKNLGDSGFPDRIAWIKAAAAKYPQLDLAKGVGIYGGSAGGQSSTRAVLAFGDFYKVAVSDCGCHDNRMDKVWWNEMWMSWPVGPHYAEQSNVTQAHKLKGKLMLVVGELDHNVDPASTMQVANALIKADKDFDLLIIPGAGHGSAETPYGSRRRMDFFVRNLLGAEPRGK
ncbi:S9 family peptidase [Fimbriiglobus ruber]|uniref:Dipeptidyl peptidase IV n=1 Tax=Fimbriiglobus ruber TaxID=1908690 RepID=A0A225DKM0_9BACT|nr:DPP IV N-terminal domain-containing protein [Fimbriiglobus ruber]OWK36697.1 Dipeptidyl peptidase IV [Fimbriiglobus ruber]